MINSRPQLVFGSEKAVSDPSSLRGAQAKVTFGQVNSSKNFESFLKDETKGLKPNLPLNSAFSHSAPGSPASGASPLRSNLPAYSSLNVNKVSAQLKQPSSLAVPGGRRQSPSSANLPFGMEDTRPNKNSGQKLRGQKNDSSSLANINSGQQGTNASSQKLTGNSNKPLKFFNSADMGTNGGSTGLSIVKDESGFLLMNSSKNNSRRRNDYQSILLSGASTQTLLKAFKAAEENPLSNSISSLLLAEQEANLSSEILDNEEYQRMSPAKKKVVLNGPDTKKLILGASKIESTIGSLAAKFESGESGIAAIGYDRHGGTSYGKYQISSRAGTMRQFLSYLDENAPDIAQSLSLAGSTNTGSRYGNMPSAWKSIAAAEPERFERLQEDFIKNSHFDPAMMSILDETGLKTAKMSGALQEVVFSTAVQHGPTAAARIISRAIKEVGADSDTSNKQAAASAEQDIIRQIYSLRSRQFGSSNSKVRSAVQSRLRNEMSDALAMLENSLLEQRKVKIGVKKSSA